MTTRGVLGNLLSVAFLLGLLGFASVLAAKDQPKAAALGQKVSRSHALRDVRGNRRPLHDFTGHKALVIAFVGTECPVANLYLPELIQLEKKYRSKEVQFLAIYANAAEDLDQ